jgi:NAD(P)-dependent dehydrogenase (short-subunit alcohol dehydrogenase family)
MPAQARDAKVAIVTGGATGIGEAAVAGLADAGWHVWALGRRRSALDALEASTSAKGLVCDVSVGSDVDAAVAHILEFEGRLDGLVLNAGTMVEGTLGDTTVEQWDQAIGINLTGAYLVAHACLEALTESKGSVVSISSVAGLRAAGGLAAYSISKAGLLMLSHSIAVDYGPRGVRSNVVCPGWTRSEMADAEMAAFAEMAGGGVEDAYEEVTRLVPQRRPGTSAEVAQAIIWLLSEAASYVNGATLSVDGGLGILEVGTIGYDFTVAPRA